jgi:hypothetical protein
MTINTRTLEGRQREAHNTSLMILKRRLTDALNELDYLIMATPSGERRDTLTEVNIHVMHGADMVAKLRSEQS